MKLTNKLIQKISKIACMILISMGTSVFANPKMNADIEKGIEYHNKARTEGFEYAEKCCEVLKPYIKTNAYACAYYGSAQTIIAGFVADKNPIKSLEYLQLGGEFLDEALAMDSEDPHLHLIHLENGIEVSRNSPIRRYSAIRTDIKWLLDNENINNLDADTKAEAYLYCGYFKIDEGDLDYALELFENAVAASPKSDAGKSANKMLDKYTE